MRLIIHSLIIALTLVLSCEHCCPTEAQENPERQSDMSSIDDFNWISGNWKGNAMGGTFEEAWNPASGGAMMGMFKFIDDDKIKFYELLTIVPSGDSMVLRLKHFDAGLKGWEEKNESIEFPLISVSPTEANFDGLTFTKINQKRMDIVVVTKQGDQLQELKFECHRVGSEGLATETAQQKPITRIASKTENHATLAIARIFEIDSVLAKQRDNLPITQPLALAVESYVAGLNALDFSGCPTEFSQPFERHCEAWKNSIPFFSQHDELRGEMHQAIEKIRSLGPEAVTELDRQMKPIMETWQDVEKAAKQFGVNRH